MVLRYQTGDNITRTFPDLPLHIFHGTIVHSKTPRRIDIIQDAFLGVRGDGTVAFLQEYKAIAELRSQPGFENAIITRLAPSQFLFPGLVDTHLHAPQWPNLALGMDGDLREWIEEFTDPVEASYSDNVKARRVYNDVVKTTLKLGSTTVAYNTTLHVDATNILADCCLEAGQRAIIGKMCVTQGSTHGNKEESVDDSLQDSLRCLEYMRSIDPNRRLIHPSVMPRGGPYCPPDLMEGLGKQSQDYLTYAQLHMCETQSDIDRTLEMHSRYQCYSDMYKASGLFHPKTIAAHCIHLSKQDIKNLKDCRAGVAHCPNSNTCLRDGECKVRDLLDENIKVGLGTDCSAGYTPSILDAMRSTSNVSRHLAVRENDSRYVLRFSEIVYMSTMGGADVLDMQDKIGNFEVGKSFDALLVDVKDVISVDDSLWNSGYDGVEAMVKKWVFLGDDRTIRQVWVNGNCVVK